MSLFHKFICSNKLKPYKIKNNIQLIIKSNNLIQIYYNIKLIIHYYYR